MVLVQGLGESGSVATLGDPVKLSRTPSVIGLPPPGLGEHTKEVLIGLGLTADQMRAASEPLDPVAAQAAGHPRGPDLAE
jgi:crotonobetainyl-CoA:carnitine CoA-transferase CaiB-like acyl-CoA transferase